MEWSGILFYSLKGSIRNPESLVFTVEDILPMHKGTKSYTEYNIDERYMDYIMEDEKRMDYKMGHIHSHNSMGVFFSGTDMDELNTNARAHNFYLSLIVNNFMEFTAKVGYLTTMETVVPDMPYMGIDENGEKYEVERKDFTVTSEKMFQHDCEIVVNVKSTPIEKDFMMKVDGIIKDSIKSTQPVTKSWTPKSKVPTVTRFPTYQNPYKPQPTQSFLDISEDLFEVDEYEHFVVCLMNFSATTETVVKLEDILSSYEELGMTPLELSTSVASNYGAIYEAFFPLQGKDEAEKTDNFIETTERIIEILEENESLYPIVSMTIDTLKETLMKFEEYGTAI